MTEAVHLSEEQWAMVQRLEAETKRFIDQPALRASPEAIEPARRLIEQAHMLKVPDIAIHGLRICVNMYDIEMDLPEHLGDLNRLGGTD
jgi:hypothetical protein